MSSCYETKIETDAIVYDKEFAATIVIDMNALSLSGSNYYFGKDSTESSTLASNTIPHHIQSSSCIKNLSIDISSSSASGDSECTLNINENQNTDTTLAIGSSTGLFEKSLNVAVGFGDRLRVQISGAALGGAIVAVSTITFGTCD